MQNKLLELTRGHPKFNEFCNGFNALFNEIEKQD